MRCRARIRNLRRARVESGVSCLRRLPTHCPQPGLPLFPWGFFRGLQLCTTFGIRPCGSAASAAHTGASPPPPPLSPAVAVAVRRWGARRGVGFRLGGFFLTRRDRLFERGSRRVSTACAVYRYCDERETATTCVQRTLRSSIDSMRPRYSHATCSTCQIIQLRSVRVHSIRYCPIRIRRTEDADTCSMQNSPPLSKSARVAATVIDSQRTFRHAEVGTARVPP